MVLFKCRSISYKFSDRYMNRILRTRTYKAFLAYIVFADDTAEIHSSCNLQKIFERLNGLSK